MKKRLIVGALAALFAWQSAGASENVELSIRFYDKKVYFTANAGIAEPVYVETTLRNNTPETWRFKLADERVFSVDYDVRTLANRSLAPADYLLRKRSESRNVYFREVALEPGESFSFVEDLRNYADLSAPGSFVVQARIFPSLFRAARGGSELPAGAPLESNRLNLNLRPPLLEGPGGIPFEMDVETNAVLVREKLAPDAVVRYMLDARIKSQWEKFFLYLDLPALLSRDAARRRAYLAESEEGRLRMVARYREDLEAAVVDGDISVIPSDYRIDQVAYNNDIGTVVATEWFTEGRITERRRYTYHLRRTDDVWLVEDYTPVKLGTE